MRDDTQDQMHSPQLQARGITSAFVDASFRRRVVPVSVFGRPDLASGSRAWRLGRSRWKRTWLSGTRLDSGSRGSGNSRRVMPMAVLGGPDLPGWSGARRLRRTRNASRLRTGCTRIDSSARIGRRLVAISGHKHCPNDQDANDQHAHNEQHTRSFFFF